MTQAVSNAEILNYFAPERCLAEVQGAHDDLSYDAAERIAGIMRRDRIDLIKTAIDVAVLDKTTDNPELRLTMQARSSITPETISPVTILINRPKLNYKHLQYHPTHKVRNKEYLRLQDMVDEALPEATELQKGKLMGFLGRDDDHSRYTPPRYYDRPRRLPGQLMGPIPEVQRHDMGLTFTSEKLSRSRLKRMPGVGAQTAEIILRFIQYHTLTRTY